MYSTAVALAQDRYHDEDQIRGAVEERINMVCWQKYSLQTFWPCSGAIRR